MTVDESGDAVVAAAVAAAVLGIEDVVTLTTGPADQFRTYLPGGSSVAGVRVDDDTVQLDLVARYGRPLVELGDHVAAVATPLVGDRTVRVTIRDVVLPGDVPEPDPADSVSEPPTEPATRDGGTAPDERWT